MFIKKIALAVVVALSMSAANASSIVSNGGFESGLTGWTVSTTDGNADTGLQGLSAFEGAATFWGFDNGGTGTLEQILNTNIGATYQVSFAFATNGSVPPNSLSFSVGNLSGNLPLAQYNWNTYAGTFTASSTSTALDFHFQTVGGTGTVSIDAVSVQAVPEPETYAMLLAGLGLMGAVARRKQK